MHSFTSFTHLSMMDGWPVRRPHSVELTMCEESLDPQYNASIKLKWKVMMMRAISRNLTSHTLSDRCEQEVSHTAEQDMQLLRRACNSTEQGKHGDEATGRPSFSPLVSTPTTTLCPFQYQPMDLMGCEDSSKWQRAIHTCCPKYKLGSNAKADMMILTELHRPWPSDASKRQAGNNTKRKKSTSNPVETISPNHSDLSG